MKPNKLKIRIDEEITEQRLIEDCLMKFNSGYEYKVVFFFYALAKGWHIDKLEYYLKLIEESRLVK